MSYLRVAAVAVTAAALVAGTLGAPSAGADTSTNAAFALAAEGLLKVDRVPNVTNTHGFAQDSVVDFATPGHTVRAKALNAQAGRSHAKASITQLTVDLSPLQGLHLDAVILTATAIESVCDHGTAHSSLAGARLGQQALQVSAPANTKVEVPGLVSVVLNKQTHHKDGSVTVTAVSLKLTAVQTVDLASATCRATSGGDDDTQPPTSTPTTLPTTPTTSHTTSTPDNGTPEHASGTVPGQAPRPTPIPGHLDVTG